MARDTREAATDKINWTYHELRERLMGGENARDRGGEDGRKNYPPAASDTPTAYQRDVLHRGEELVQVSEETTQNEIQLLVADLRENPFHAPGAGPEARCASVVEEAASDMDLLVQDHTNELGSLAENHKAALRDEKRRYQAAGGVPPTGDWVRVLDFWLIAILLVSLEAVLSFVMLRHALGQWLAFVSGIVMPAAVFGFGYGTGHLLLRPENRSAKGGEIALRRAGAVAGFLLGLMLVYWLSCWRAAHIAAADGPRAQTAWWFFHPLQAMSEWETIGLAVLGLAGFAAGCWKGQDFWGGFVPPLRKASITRREAARKLNAVRDDVVDQIKAKADEASDDLDELLRTARAWAGASADRADRARVCLLDHDRRRELLQRAVDAVMTDYAEGNLEVRTEAPPAWPSIPFIGRELHMPERFDQVRETAARLAEAWAAVTRQSKASVAAAREGAIDRIDRTCGFTRAGRGAMAQLPRASQ